MKNKNLEIVYQCFVALGAVALFFTEADIYFGRINISPFNSLGYIILFIFATVPLYFSFFQRFRYLPIPLIIYSGIYVIIAAYSFLLSDFTDIVFEEFRARVLTVIFLFTMLMIFSKYEIVLFYTRRAIVLAGLLSVGNNIYEFLHPGIFGGLNETGRPAGFYVDPNMSGAGLLISLIFGIGVLPNKLRIPFILAIAIGIFLTFSRGALLCLFLVIAILYFYQVIPRQQSFYWGIGLGLSIFVISFLGLQFINLKQLENMGLLNENTMSRLAWFEAPTSDQAYHRDDRKELAELGWKKFTQHPWVGNGLATSHQWKEEHRSTHNMYLYFLVDHGFLGLFIYPCFIYATIINMRQETKSIGVSFAGFMLFWGLFSHTVLTQRDMLIVFALMATINHQSQLKSKLKPKPKTENLLIKL